MWFHKIETSVKSQRFVTTIKKSRKRSLWQLKDQDHAIYSLHGLNEVIESSIEHLGSDVHDISKIYELVFSSTEYSEFQFKLERADYGPDFVNYKICINKINDLSSVVWLPKILFNKFVDYPDNLFINIREAQFKRIIFIEEE